MTKHMIRKFKWFWPWQDEQEEEWLSVMATEGWHLERLGFPGYYHFREGEPEEMVNRLGYQSQHREDRES